MYVAEYLPEFNQKDAGIGKLHVTRVTYEIASNLGWPILSVYVSSHSHSFLAAFYIHTFLGSQCSNTKSMYIPMYILDT